MDVAKRHQNRPWLVANPQRHHHSPRGPSTSFMADAKTRIAGTGPAERFVDRTTLRSPAVDSRSIRQRRTQLHDGCTRIANGRRFVAAKIVRSGFEVADHILQLAD